MSRSFARAGGLRHCRRGVIALTTAVALAACSTDRAEPPVGDPACGPSQECAAGDTQTVTMAAPDVAVSAYRTNAQVMATATAAAAAVAAQSAPKAEDIPLETSSVRLEGLTPNVIVQGSGDLRPDLVFVAATGKGVPDTMGAVGPTQYLVVLNSIVRSFDKATGQPDGVLNVTLQGFFGSAGIAACCDPKVRFDRLSGRWFVGSMFRGNMLLAVSDGGVLTPGSGWRFFAIPQDQVTPPGDAGCWVDYTRMAVDEHAVYFVYSVFTANYATLCNAGGWNLNAYVVRKASVLGGGPPVVTAFRGPGPINIPVDQYEPGSAVGYLSAANQIYRVLDPGGTPTLSGPIPISGSSFQRFNISAVRHKGNVLESGVPGNTAGRMFLATFGSHAVPLRRNHLWLGELWGVDNTGQPGSNATRNALGFLDVQDVSGSTPSVAQSGVVAFGPSAANDLDQRNYWMPALMVNGQGHIAMAGSAAGTNEYINAAVGGRLATDGPGVVRTPVLVTQAAAPYNPSSTFSGGLYRWGDYSNLSLDPTDDQTMWAIQQFAVGGDVWGIAVARIRAPGPPPSVSAAPGTITQSTASMPVTVTGVPTDGEGFFDPGPGFAGRLRATVSGGVRVHQVGFTSPTSLLLDVSTECAANGPHALTIVNPDGQSVTVQSALTTNITPAPVRRPPGAPVLTGAATSTTLGISWQAAVSGCETVSFLLEAGTAPGASDLYVGSVGAATSLQAAVPRGVYYIRVRGTNDLGTGPASNELQLLVGTSAPPGPPGGLVGTVSGQLLSLSWQPPSSGGAVDGYVLEAGTAPGLSNIGAIPLPPSPTAIQAPGVPPGTYYLRVRARNAGGTSQPSNEVSVVVSSSTPGAPTNLSATVSAGRTVSIAWSAPATGGAVTSYRLEAGSASGLANIAVVPLAASPTGIVAPNVPPGRYFLRVRGVNAAGAGGPSNEIIVDVP
ncbi:MAG: fibronectin type III domain-containing protein [Vicinamibacterales bacterium]